jgi:hypothetical protein
MATQTIANQPLPELDILAAKVDDEAVGPVLVVEPSEETADPMRPARGIPLGVVICAPFWIAVYWLLR